MSKPTPHSEPELVNGKLRPCPQSPNCVCSEFSESEHSIEPLTISGDPTKAWSRLLGILSDQPRTTIVSQTEDYIQARVRTRILRFEDVL